MAGPAAVVVAPSRALLALFVSSSLVAMALASGMSLSEAAASSLPNFLSDNPLLKSPLILGATLVIALSSLMSLVLVRTLALPNTTTTTTTATTTLTETTVQADKGSSAHRPLLLQKVSSSACVGRNYCTFEGPLEALPREVPAQDLARLRDAVAVVDLGAIEHNVRTFVSHVAPAAVFAVVKANAYGHGAEPVARAALAAGASGLAVAFVFEGVALRRSGTIPPEVPILVLSEQPARHLDAALEAQLTLTVGSIEGAHALVQAASRADPAVLPGRCHIMIDTGMHRQGIAPADARSLLDALDGVRVDGMLTHMATADQRDHVATPRQVARFDAVLRELRDAGRCPPLVHLANSATALALEARHRHSLVRLGIAMYGLSAGRDADGPARTLGLRPALEVHAAISRVAVVEAGEGVAYGWRTVLTEPRRVATVPLGYADGVPRRLPQVGGQVLVRGQRCPILGVVTMDQLLIDVDGLEKDVTVGEPVVLIGKQGDDFIGADDWADLLGTIGYEIACGISARMPRAYIRRT